MTPTKREASAPGKLILFGEWAVLDGLTAVGVALQTRFRAIFSREALSSAPLRLNTVDHGDALYTPGAKAQDPFFENAFRVLNSNDSVHFDRDFRGARIDLECDWRLAEGLGTSSALFLTLSILSRGHVPPVGQFPELRQALINSQDGHGSGFDLAIQLLGGAVIMRGFAPENVDLGFPPNLRLIHTGQKFSTVSLLKKGAGPGPSERATLGKIADDFTRDHAWKTAIENSFAVLAASKVVPDEIRHAKSDWLKKGWIDALKTCGAGGGDTLLTLVNTVTEAQLLDDIRQRGWWMSRHTFGAPGAHLVSEDPT